MESFKKTVYHFFTKGEAGEFTLFSLAHFLPILAAVAIIFLIWWKRDALANRVKVDNALRLALSFTCILAEMSYYWRIAAIPSLDTNPANELPLTLCEWAVIFCAYLVITKNQFFFDIAYFWLFGGSVFALIIPVVIGETGPTRFRFYQFWVVHTVGYISVCYMMFVHKMRPTWRSMVRAFVGLGVLGTLAVLANNMLGDGADYLFLAKPVIGILPEQFLPRTLIMLVAVAALFFLSYLPWFIIDKQHQKSKEAPAPLTSEVTQ